MTSPHEAPGEDGIHRPRPNDHLVEPFFGGLGVDGEAVARPDDHGADSDAVELAPARGGWFQRLLRALKPG